MRFLISAGEASGETYGAQLIAALGRRAPAAEFFGVGGSAMRAAGCDTIVDAGSIAVVGLFEVISHLPHIYAEYKRLLRAADERRPDAAILIDFPDFNFRLARALHTRGIPVIYYVSPQMWAWRAGRVKFIQRYVRKMLVIFPFEEEWYRRRGVEAVYTGHPLADAPPPEASRSDFARQYGLSPEKNWVALLPGSRRKEVGMNLPPMLAAAALLNRAGSYEFLLPRASTLEPQWLQNLLADCGASWAAKLPDFKITPVIITNDARASLLHSRVAAVASGTATVQAALLGIPFVIVYRVAPLTWMLGRRFVSVPHYGMPNLIAGREIVPELIQGDFTPQNVAARIGVLIPDSRERQEMLTRLALVRQALHSGPEPAAERAAATILDALGFYNRDICASR